jgi:hypothetical protein
MKINEKVSTNFMSAFYTAQQSIPKYPAGKIDENHFISLIFTRLGFAFSYDPTGGRAGGFHLQRY